MKKITALGLGTLLGLSAIAAPQVIEKISRVDAVKTAHEAMGKKVKGLNRIRTKAQAKSGLEFQTSLKRLGVNALPGARKAPLKLSAAKENLYGFLIYYEGDYENYSRMGYCSINPETGSFSNVIPSELTATGVGQKDGKLYMTAYESFWGYIIGAYNLVYDLESGDIIEMDDIDTEYDINQVFTAAGFDAEEGVFYGVNADGEFTTYNIETKEYNYYGSTISAQAITYNAESGEVVGIISAADGTYLLNYDKATGEADIITEVAYSTDYLGGLCYSSEDGGYVWNPNSDDWSKLVLISESGSVTEICDVEDVGEFSVLVNTDTKKVDPNAPAKAEIESIDFTDAELSGKVVIKLPSLTEGGEAISGEVSYKLSCDGEEIAAGNGAAGSSVTIDVTVGQGKHTFSVVCSVGDIDGRQVSQSAYVGNDTPCAPADVKLTATTVSWDAVTEGVNGGYVDAAAVTYTVALNGNVIAENITETSCATGLPENIELDLYVATVTASCNGLTSAAASSNDLLYGDALTVPVDLAPTAQQAKLFTILDGNGDGSSWSYNEGGKMPNSFRYLYNSGNDGDDWLILPAVKMDDTESLYLFSMKDCCQSASYPERLEVCIGTAPEADAMTRVLLEPKDINYADPAAEEMYFTIDEPGEYYIGIHAISDADKYYLYVGDFKIENTGIHATGPAAASGIKAVAAAEGALSATISATLPTKAIDGSDIAAGTQVTMTVSSAAGEASVEGVAGAEVSVEVATEQGDNRIRVQTSVGENLGMVDYVNVFTGIDVPGLLTDMKAESSEDNLSAKITWAAPTVGANGGYVAPTGITYYTCEQSIFGWQLGEEIGTDVYEYEVSVPAGSPQASQVVAIVGFNEAGSGLISSVSVPLGQLYELPAKETFANDELAYGPVTIYNGAVQMDWGLGDPGEIFGVEYMNETGNALMGYAFEATSGMLRFPRFDTASAGRPTLEFTVYCGDIENILVNASGYGVETREIFNLSETEHGTGYQKFSVELPDAFKNNPWTSFEFEAILGEYGGFFILDSYTLMNKVDHDLAVTSIVAPASASIGATIDVIANVENQGMEAEAYKGGVFFLTGANGTVIASKAVEADKTLAPGEAATASTQFDIIAECLGDCNVKFVLTTSDENQGNNEKSAALKVTRGSAVVVTDLAGEWNESGTAIDLTWSPASYAAGFESFENNTPFELSGDMIGEFINVDRDGKPTYCWSAAQGDGIPEMSPIAFEAGAFNVINGDVLNKYFGDGSMDAAEGEQCLLAFCPADGSAADDWLISPELTAGSSFSFYVKPLTLQYGPEAIEVCYSTGSIDPADFKVLQVVSIDQADWSELEFTLPADGVRFAIHYVAEDIFGVMIDALKYSVKDATSIASYDVYRADFGQVAEKIGSTDECAYSDATAEAGKTYTYYVVPVMASGAEGEKSNVVVVGLTGIDNLKAAHSIIAGRGEIVIKGYAGEVVSISNVAGQAFTVDVTSDAESVSVPAGIYLVKGADKAVKIIVK